MLKLRSDCEIVILSAEDLISDFDCGDADLNDFFNHDALNYKLQMLSETCFFRKKDCGEVVCAFSFSEKNKFEITFGVCIREHRD